MSDESGASPRFSVAFRTLGCKVNRVESDAIATELLGMGAVIADEDRASVIVINTCTVTGEADAKARKAVRHALGAPGAPVVVATGCLAAIDADALRSLGPRVVVESDKRLVARRVAEALSLDEARGSTGAVGERERAAEPQPAPPTRATSGRRTRAMLKIEDGCDNFCSYCIVPYARGVPRAVPLASVLADATALVQVGAREIVLTGINIGRYADGDVDLAALVRAVAGTGIHRLRVSSIEPPDLTERLLDTMAEIPALCEHLHVPLQSGSDAVLNAMGRTYDADEFEARVRAAHEAIPGLALTTDVIAGFPGETAADHAETLALVERVGFSKLHVFRYSERAGTPAAAMEQLAPEIRAQRAGDLRTLGETLRMRYVESRLGQRAEVLIESARAGTVAGTSRDYLRVQATVPGARVGDVVQVRLTRLDGDRVVGEPLRRPME